MFKQIHVAMYFSNLVFVLNFFRISPFVNTALYLGNIASLVGICVLLMINPKFPFVNFKKGITMSNDVFNAILVAMHFFPIYLFRERQTLGETFSLRSIAALSGAFLAYFIAVMNEIPLLYGVSAKTMAKLAVFILLLFLGVHAIFSGTIVNV